MHIPNLLWSNSKPNITHIILYFQLSTAIFKTIKQISSSHNLYSYYSINPIVKFKIGYVTNYSLLHRIFIKHRFFKRFPKKIYPNSSTFKLMPKSKSNRHFMQSWPLSLWIIGFFFQQLPFDFLLIINQYRLSELYT